MALATVAGCGSEKAPTATQVAAKVNKDEISVHQVNLVLQRQPRAAADQPETAARRVLDVLIEQELAAQAARSANLDNDPRFAQAQQLARREWLAKAYQDQLAERAVGPSSDEIDRYYDEHPELFSHRRLYILQETLVPGDAARVARATQIANAAKNPSELLDTLRAAAMPVQSRVVAQSAEDMPINLVQGLWRLDPGQSLVLPGNGGVRIITVVQAQLAAVDKRMAKPAIEAYIVAERKRQLVAQGMKALREKATIAYAGPFASAPAASASAPASAASQ